LDAPVCFHEAGVTPLPQVATDRFDRHGYWHVCTHPHEAQIAMVSLVLGGVTERFPRLRFGFMEAGAGWLPYWLWRMDEHFENERDWEFKGLTMEPTDYVKRQCFVSIDTDEVPGIATLETMSGGNVVWGSDYPHPDGKFPMARKTLESLPGMTPQYFRSVVQNNPLALFGERLRAKLADV
jgi:predicted TIM-barrel fold metal-dependent hydrolase